MKNHLFDSLKNKVNADQVSIEVINTSHSSILGERIRDARLNAHLSLTQLSAKIGLSRSFISQIERNVSQPSIESLRTIAYSLGISVSSLLDQAEVGANVIHADERRILFGDGTGIRYYLLSPSIHQSVIMLLTEIDPGINSGKSPMGHQGEEVALVLSGKATIEFLKYTIEVIEGDALHIDRDVPHRIINTGDMTLKIISAISAPGF